MKRRLPRWREVAPLIGRPDRTKSRIERRLARCGDLWDIRELALKRTPRSVFDYTDGAANREYALTRARDAFSRVEFQPRVMRNVAEVDTSTTLMGKKSAWPFAFAPTGFTRMMHYKGEPAVAKVAGELGIPYGLSTLGTTSVERLTAEAPDTRLWFQLYVWRDREASKELVARVEAAGYDTLLLTVDTAVGGIRLRDVRNGLTIPPQLSMRTIFDMGKHPRWWGNLLTTAPLEFASLQNTGGTPSELLTRVFDPGITGDDIAWLRSIWGGKLMLKGIQTLADAKLAADLGADGIILSTHGGRQLDRAPIPLELLPEVVDAVGDRCEVYLDGGVMSGADIVAALAFGARGVLVGRAYLFGLMAGGEEGVRRVGEILTKEIKTTLQLLGVTSIDQLGREHVRLRCC